MAERLVGQHRERDRLALALALGISERRLLGWEPEERHEHYDAGGVLTGYTIVRREPEWTDAERLKLLALGQYERSLCKCGFPIDFAADPSNYFTFETRQCPVCAAAAQYGRIQQDNEQKAQTHRGQNLPPGAPRTSDGVHSTIRTLSPTQVAQQHKHAP